MRIEKHERRVSGRFRVWVVRQRRGLEDREVPRWKLSKWVGVRIREGAGILNFVLMVICKVGRVTDNEGVGFEGNLGVLSISSGEILKYC